MTSSQLLNELRRGAEIVYNGAPVDYRPRFAFDRYPWVQQTESGSWIRCSASECQAVRSGN